MILPPVAEPNADRSDHQWSAAPIGPAGQGLAAISVGPAVDAGVFDTGAVSGAVVVAAVARLWIVVLVTVVAHVEDVPVVPHHQAAGYVDFAPEERAVDEGPPCLATRTYSSRT